MDSTRILVTGLMPTLTESILLNEFKQFGEVKYIKFKRTKATGSALISFSHSDHAHEARRQMNGKFILGSRISVCLADYFPLKECSTNVFIKNIPASVDASKLEDTFKDFGRVLNSKILYDENNNSRGYGFIMFEKKEEADRAVSNKIMIFSHLLEVKFFVPKHLRGSLFTNVYVRGFGDSFTQQDLLTTFSCFGHVVSAVITKKNGGSFGFVCFADTESAEKAINSLHGKNNLGFDWYVSRNVSKSERIIENKLKAKQNEEK